MDQHLDWHQEDYENWHRQTIVKVYKDIARIIEVIEQRQFMPNEVIQNILDKTKALQEKVGYDGDYANWTQKNTPPRLEDMI